MLPLQYPNVHHDVVFVKNAFFRGKECLHTLCDGLDPAIYGLAYTISLMMDNLDIAEPLKQSKFDR